MTLPEIDIVTATLVCVGSFVLGWWLGRDHGYRAGTENTLRPLYRVAVAGKCGRHSAMAKTIRRLADLAGVEVDHDGE